jgi:hypothetical protein
MADDTLQNGTDNLATDALVTYNGAAATGGVKVQRVKPGFGGDGNFDDVTLANPFPVQAPDLGAKADASATTDAGTFSLIALIKRLLGKLPAALGQSPAAASLPVTLSNENILDQYITGQGAQTAVGQNILLATAGTGWIDCQQYRSISIQIIGSGTITTGIVTFEESNDNVNWGLALVVAAGAPATAQVSAATMTAGSQIFSAQLRLRYFRARISTAVTGAGGALQAFALLRMLPLTPVWTFVTAPTQSITVAQATATNLQTTAALAVSSNLAADVGIAYRATTTNSASFVSVLSPATPLATTIKASAGRMVGWQLQNSATGMRSVKIFNLPIGSITLGATPAVLELDIPAGGVVSGAHAGGVGFTTAMAYSVTSAKGLTDNTATGLAANDVSGAFFYA